MAADNRDNVAYFFDLAIRQYSDISLFFYLDKCEYSHLKSLCVGVKNGHCIMRVPIAGIEQTPIVWGTEASGYFVVRDVEVTPCNFRSRLARIYNAPPDALFLVFPLPAYIDHDQRRFSKRVMLDEESAADFAVWHGVFTSNEQGALPQMRWSSLANCGCELAELSANGLRLDCNENSLALKKMAVNDEILLRGNFSSAAKPEEIYALGNIVRIMKKIDAENTFSVGCQFRSWRKTKDTGQTWFKADPREGIGQIAQWVSRNFRSVLK